MRKRFGTAFLAMLFTAAASGTTRANFDDLLEHMPAHGNVLMLVNAEGLYQSELAQREDWKGRHAKGLMAGGLILPAGATRIAVGASMDFQHMHSAWEAAAIEFAAPLSPQQIAERSGGAIDVIGTTPIIALPEETMVVPFPSGIVGVMTPATRQRAAQWIKYRGELPGEALPAYLEHAADYAKTTRGQIVLAFDLEHLLSPQYVLEELKYAESLKGMKLNTETLGATLAGLQGVTLGVFVDGSRHGRMNVDFASDASALAPIAKPLIIEVLSSAGAMIGDVNQWEVKVEGRTIELAGPLSESGMRRLLSLVEVPTHWLAAGQRADALATSDASNAMPYTSLAYFHNIEKLLRDLQAEKHNAKTIGSIALYFDAFAQRIDRMPAVNVDPELLEYGVGTAEMLRQAALALRGATITAHEKEAAIYPQLSGVYRYSQAPGYRSRYSRYGYGRSYGRYGYASSALYFQYRNVTAERRKARAAEIAKGAGQEQSVLEQIGNATSQIRVKMVEKYKLDF